MGLKTWCVVLMCGAAGTACNQPAPPPADTAPPRPVARPVSPADNIAWYRECWAHFNNKSWMEFRNCYADGAVSFQPASGGDIKGGDEILKSAQNFTVAMPDVRGEPTLMLAHGPHVASISVLRGTHTGTLRGPDGSETPATHKVTSQLFGHWIEVGPGGKVTREIGIQDSATMLNHLGLSKQPAREPVPMPTEAPTVVVAAGDEKEAANVAAIRHSYDAFNRHDLAAFGATQTPDVVLHEMANAEDQNMKQSLDGLKALWAGFPDAKVNIETIWGAGDYVVVTGSLTGTNTGTFAPMNLRNTGRSVNVRVLEIDRMEGGKIAEGWLFYEGLHFVQQLTGPPAQ